MNPRLVAQHTISSRADSAALALLRDCSLVRLTAAPGTDGPTWSRPWPGAVHRCYLNVALSLPYVHLKAAFRVEDSPVRGACGTPKDQLAPVTNVPGRGDHPGGGGARRGSDRRRVPGQPKVPPASPACPRASWTVWSAPSWSWREAGPGEPLAWSSIAVPMLGAVAGPAQRPLVNRVRVGRQQLSAGMAGCRSQPGRRTEHRGQADV